jgi:hypothetical protein
MNKRTLFGFVIVLLAALGLWTLFHKKAEPVAPPTPEDAQKQQQEKTEPTLRHAQSQVAAPPKQSHNVIIEGVPVSEDVVRYMQNVRADPTYDWKQPINFYGRVVDESNQPVAGASVDYTWSTLAANGTLTKHGESDASGVFSIHETGKRIGITVSKESYYTPPSEKLRTYEYANPGDGLFTPDPANPVTFHLRKKGQGENLIHGLKLFGSRVDGTLSYVDLIEAKNKLTPQGDLTVRCVRSERNAEKRFDWTFTLGVPEGGLIESTNEFDFVAPESGYQPEDRISHRASDPDWTGQEKHKFFMKSQNGQHYARIEITIIPDYSQNAAYDLEWYLNPNGSRNLEPMEAQPQAPAVPSWAPPGTKAVIPEFK